MKPLKSPALLYWLFLLLFIVGTLYLLLHINYGLNIIDEGFNDYQAILLLNGQIPYKDFLDIYPPGQLYLDTLFLKIFNGNILSLRMISAFTGSAMPLLSFILMLKFTKSLWPSLATWLLCLSYGLSLSLLMPVYAWNAMLLGGISFWFVLRFENSKNKLDALIAGFFLGLCALFKQTIGAYYLLAYFLIALIYWQQKWLSFKNIRCLIMHCFLGTLIIVSLCLLPIYWHSAYQDFLTQVIIFPLTLLKTQPAWLYTPRPQLVDLKNLITHLNVAFIPPWLYFFQLITIALSLIVTVIGYLRHRINKWLVIMLVLTACSFLLNYERFSLLKVTTTLPYSIILMGLLCHELLIHLKHNRYKIIFNSFLCLVILACSTIGVLLNQMAFPSSYFTTKNPIYPHVYISSDDAYKYLHLNQILEKLNTKGQYVFVYPYSPMYYIMFNLKNPTPYSTLLSDQMINQNTVIQNLKSKKVRYLIYDQFYSVDGQSFAESFPIIQDYINSHYHIIASLGPKTAVWLINK